MEMVDVLHLAGDPVLVPAAVVGEVTRRGGVDAATRALRSVDWLRRIDDPPIPAYVRALRLGDGEQAAIAWALAHPGTEVVLDDLDARRHAISLGVPVRGTLSLILEAKRRGDIVRARPVIDRARRAGLYLSDRLVQEALRLVGE